MIVNVWFFFTLIGFAFSQYAADSDTIAREYEQLNKQSLNWGPYRSNLYVGITPCIPKSIITGLLWFPAETFNGVLLSKHACDQGHNIKKFGWTKYDPRYGGLETIFDNDSKLELNAEFIKTDDGLNWALRIKGHTERSDSVNSVVFYAGLQDDGKLELENELYKNFNNLVEDDVVLNGNMDKLGGDFKIKIIDDENNVFPISNVISDKSYDPSLTHHLSLTAPFDEMWKANEIFWTLVKFNIEELESSQMQPQQFPPIELFQLRNPSGFKGNLHFIQKTFVGDFQFDIIFNVDKSEKKIDSTSLSDKIKQTLELIDDKFTKKFQLNAPFNTNEYIRFAKELLSQLLGGIIYLNGDQQVDRNAVVDDVRFSHADLKGSSEGPYELFTCVPSRPFFPRGFYWDEGFHLLPILEYDSDLTLEIVKSWFSLIDDNGWIGREQILGAEARSKVPAEFTVQNPNIANPPTLMLIFSELLDSAKKLQLQQEEQIDILADNDQLLNFDKMKEYLGDLHMENPELMIKYAQEIYPNLKKHYEWFRKTQRGNTEDLDRSYHNNDEVYRWKGRTKDHCLPSGIDDYPRCEADIGELNVDLLSWMGVMTRSMYKIAKLLDQHDDAKLYKKRFDDIIINLNQVHWSEDDQLYCDVTVDDDDNDIFECHEGYVSLMPFINRLVSNNDTKKLISSIKSLRDSDTLWSEYGIRSLSKQDFKFHKDEDYWRGHIWININYLALEALYYYGSQSNVDSEVKLAANEAYIELRKNIVNNVYNVYQETGYAWEQYNEETGNGQRTRHFLGWTSLVILMMKMPKEIL